MASLFPQLLWDLLPSRKKRKNPKASVTPRRPARHSGPSGTTSGKVTARQQRYDELVREMKTLHGLRVNKWRSSTSGCAWEVQYADGTVSRLIESPYPRGPMSCAVFMHEVGHHAIGLHRYRPRCLEEYHAWRWGPRGDWNDAAIRSPNVSTSVETTHFAMRSARPCAVA